MLDQLEASMLEAADAGDQRMGPEDPLTNLPGLNFRLGEDIDAQRRLA